MKSEKALEVLIRQFAVIKDKVTRIKEVKRDFLKFSPSQIKVDGNFIEQSVHFIFGNGKIKYNAVVAHKTFGYANQVQDKGTLQSIQDALQYYTNVEKIVIFIKDRIGRELIVYELEDSPRVLNNYRDIL
jgi:hypothetical protein